MKINRTTFPHADEPSSVGTLWIVFWSLIAFWVGVYFCTDALVAWWITR
jgi:hypothetical protein